MRYCVWLREGRDFIGGKILNDLLHLFIIYHVKFNTKDILVNHLKFYKHVLSPI